MQYQKIRSSKQRLKAFEGLLWHNAVLYFGLALPYVIVAATSLKNAAALSIAMMFATVPTALIMSFIPAKFPGWLRYVPACLISMVFVILSYFPIQFLSLEIFDSLGIFLPLVAVSSLVFEVSDKKLAGNWSDAIITAIRFTVGFGIVALLVGLIRELLGSGSVWGIQVMKFKIPGVLPVFFGFIIVAFLSAGAKLLWRYIMAAYIKSENPLPDLKEKEGGKALWK